MVGSNGLPMKSSAGARGWGDGDSDPLAHSQYFDAVIAKRVVAYLIDALIIFLLLAVTWFVGSILSVLTLGLLFPAKVIVMACIPLAYHTLLVGRHCAATIGMEKMGLEVRRIDGGRPDHVQAFLMALMFYGSVGMTGFLIILIALFNRRHRCLHDFLSGVVVVNRIRLPDFSVDGAGNVSA